jgi:aspartate/methionine/tyrosine aminotransferase
LSLYTRRINEAQQTGSEIAESPTFALNEEARLLRERGEAVINLGIGEPKNKTPIAAVLASAAKLTSGEIKYTPARRHCPP